MKKRTEKLVIIILRIAVGWFLLYQGVTAILTPNWSIVPLVQNAHTFPAFYESLMRPDTLEYVTYLIKGAYILAGALLIIGLFVRVGAFIGIGLELLFYFPLLMFPNVGLGGYYIVDEHIIIAIVLAFLFIARAGELFGLGTMFKFSRY